eukprot:1394299-Amorphochlora_amoeboformis.AAC.1
MNVTLHSDDLIKPCEKSVTWHSDISVSWWKQSPLECSEVISFQSQAEAEIAENVYKTRESSIAGSINSLSRF